MIYCTVRFATRKMCALPHVNFPQLRVAKVSLATFFKSGNSGVPAKGEKDNRAGFYWDSVGVYMIQSI